MPDVKEPGVQVELDEYKREKEEFDESVDAIFAEGSDITDDEINATLDKELGKKDTAGEAIRDPEADSSKTDGDDPIIDPSPDKSLDQGISTDTHDDDSTDWKTKALEAEAKLTDVEAKLAKEVQKTSSWNGRIKKANDRVRELEEQLTSKTNDTQSDEYLSDEEKIEKFRTEFPELGDVIDIMQKRTGTNKTVLKSDPIPEENDLDTTATPDATDKDEPSEHYVATRKAHPDLDEIVRSGVLATWINKQKDFIKPHLLSITNSGTVDQVVDMVSNFKDETGWKSQLDKGGKETSKQDKLNAMKEVDSESGGPVDTTGPDKNDYDQGAKDAGL